MYSHFQWQQPNKQTVTLGTVPTTNRFAFTTTNKFNGLENDMLVEDGNYKLKWMLYMAASGHCGDSRYTGTEQTTNNTRHKCELCQQ